MRRRGAVAGREVAGTAVSRAASTGETGLCRFRGRPGGLAKPEAPASASCGVLGKSTVLRESPPETPKGTLPGAGGWRREGTGEIQPSGRPWKPRETEARRGAGEEGWSCDPRCHPGRGPSTGQEPGFPGETEARCQWARRGRGLWGAEHPTAPAKSAGALGRGRALWALLAKFKPSRLCPPYSLGLRNLPEAVNSEGFPLLA